QGPAAGARPRRERDRPRRIPAGAALAAGETGEPAAQPEARPPPGRRARDRRGGQHGACRQALPGPLSEAGASYTRRALRRLIRPTKRPSPALRTAVRIGAGAAVAASIIVPAFRRRLKAKPAVSVAAAVAGPPALAVLRPRTRKRDVALYALQMWGFTAAHEIPYDDPDALRRRLRIDYPIKIDRRIGGGVLPNARLQRALAHPENPTLLDRA